MIYSGPFSHFFKLTLGEYLVPDFSPDASCLCACGKGCGLSIKGQPCKRVFSKYFYPYKSWDPLHSAYDFIDFKLPYKDYTHCF